MATGQIVVSKPGKPVVFGENEPTSLEEARKEQAALRQKAVQAAYGVAAGSQAEADLYPKLEEEAGTSAELQKGTLRSNAARALAGGLERSGRMASGGGFLAAQQGAAGQVSGAENELEAAKLRQQAALQQQGAAATTMSKAQQLEAIKFEKEAKGDKFKKLQEAQNNAASLVQGYKGFFNDDEGGAAAALDEAATASEDPDVAAYYRKKAQDIRDGTWDF